MDVKQTLITMYTDEPQAAFEQRPEDFMDEEDMGEFGIAPRQLLATQDFALQPYALTCSC